MMTRFTNLVQYKEACIELIEQRMKDCYDNVKQDFVLPDKRHVWLQKYENLKDFKLYANYPIDQLNSMIKERLTLISEDVNEWVRFSTSNHTEKEIILAATMTVEFDISMIAFTYLFNTHTVSEEMIEELQFITSGVLFERVGTNGSKTAKSILYYLEYWDQEHVDCLNRCNANGYSSHNDDEEYIKLFPKRVKHKVLTRKYLQRYLKSAYVASDKSLWFTISEENDFFTQEDIEAGNIPNIDPRKIKCLPFNAQIWSFSKYDFLQSLKTIDPFGEAKKVYDAYLEHIVMKPTFDDCNSIDILTLICGRNEYKGERFAFDSYNKEWYLVHRRYDDEAMKLCHIKHIDAIHDIKKIDINAYCAKGSVLKPYDYHADKTHEFPERLNWQEIKSTQKLSKAFIKRHKNQFTNFGAQSLAIPE